MLIAGCSSTDPENPVYPLPTTPESRPHVFVIMIDTLRADHLGLFGYTRNTAPNIAAFAEHATAFTNAIAPCSWSLPSTTSILLGKFGFKHSMHRTDLLPREYPESGNLTDTILPYYIRQSGYRTYSIQANAFVSVVDDQFVERGKIGRTSLQDSYAVQNAVSWLSKNGGSGTPVLISLGLMGPHWPYEARTGYMHEFLNDATYATSAIGNYMSSNINLETDCITMQDLTAESRAALANTTVAIVNSCIDDSRVYVSAYDGEIKYSDAQLGDFFGMLKRMGIYDSSMIVIFGDHGESLDERYPYFLHGNSLYQSLLHVPLLIKLPGQKDKQVIKRYVRTIDIYPTVMDYLSIPAPAGVDGRSLLPIIYGRDTGAVSYPAVSYQVHKGIPRASYIDGRYKLIASSEGAWLYDLVADPTEKVDLAADMPDKVLGMKYELSQYYFNAASW